MIVVDYRGPKFLRSLVERCGWNLFDRVVELRLERDTPTAQIDFETLTSLERIAKSTTFVPSTKLMNTPMDGEFADLWKKELDAYMRNTANVELKYLIPESRIAKYGHTPTVWWVELTK